MWPAHQGLRRRQYRTEHKGNTPNPRIGIKIPEPAGNRTRTAGLEGRDSTDHAMATDTILLLIYIIHFTIGSSQIFSLTHSLTLSLTRSLVHPPTHSPTQSPTPALTHSFFLSSCVHRCGTSGSMRACHASGPGSTPGRDKFPG